MGDITITPPTRPSVTIGEPGTGTDDHRDLTHRDADDSHPISAITGLQAALDAASEGGGAVDSVNGQTGVVVLDAGDVSADPAGTGATEAAAAVTAHEAAANPHPTYLTAAEGDAAYDALGAAAAAEAASDPAGTAAAAVSAHEALSDPHPGYLTSTEGNAAYSPLGHTHSGVYEPAGTVATHEADTTNVHGITDTSALETTTGSQAKADAKVSDTAYDATSWDGDTTHAPSKNAVRDKIAAIDATLASLDSVGDLLAGVVAPPGELARWKSGPGIPATKLAEDLTSGETDVDVAHAGAFPQSGVARVVFTGTEECLDAGSGTTTRTWTRGVNGTTAAAHTTGDAVFPSRMRTVVGLGDSIQQGTTGGTDAYFDRAFRQLAQRFGGQAAQAWPLWRQSALSNSASEWTLSGTVTPLSQSNAYALCPYGSVIFTSGTGNGATWTRPPWVTVACIDLLWVDPGTTGDGFSYRFDSGSWTTNPAAGTGSTGSPKLRRLRITDVPANFTTFEVRAANAAGTGEAFTLPYMPLITYPSLPFEGQTEGLRNLNLGWDGQKLRTALNARSYFDVVTNGTGVVTSATGGFVTADAGSTVYCGAPDGTGTWTTVTTRDSASQLTLAASIASGTAQQITIFQGDHTGDYMRFFEGDAGSVVPDLIVFGPWTNDETTAGSLGDGNPEAMRAMAQYCLTEFARYADVLIVCRYEADSAVADQLQADYRAVFHELAAANAHVAVCDLYEAFAAAGYTGGPAMTTASLTLDGIHLSQAGHYIAGDYLARVLGVL